MSDIHLSWSILSGTERGVSYIATEQRICAKCTSLSIVVRVKDNEDVFYGHHNSNTPDYNGEHSNKVLARRCLGERRRKDVERAGSNISVYDTD